MKKGINYWSYTMDGSLTAQEAIDLAKADGFSGIELTLELTGKSIILDSTEKEVKDIAAYAKKQQIDLPSVATGLYWTNSLTANSAAVTKKAYNIVLKQLQIAKWLGADTILVVPGAVDVFFIPGAEKIPYDIA